MISVKILENLVNIGIKDQQFNEALDRLIKENYFSLKDSGFESCQSYTFRLLMTKISSINSYKWDSLKFSNQLENVVGENISSLVRQMIASPCESIWKDDYNKVLQDLLLAESQYNKEDFETVLSICGAQTISYDIGANGINHKNQKVSIIGYSKSFANNQIKPIEWNTTSEWKESLQSAIVMVEDPESTKKYKIENCKIKDLSLSSSLDKNNCPVLDREKISSLLFDKEDDIENDSEALFKRFLKLKALSTQLRFNKIADLGLSTDQTYQLLINCLSTILDGKVNYSSHLKHDHYELKLKTLLKFATENKISIKKQKYFKCSFINKRILLRYSERGGEEMAEYIKPLKAFNYPSLNQ